MSNFWIVETASRTAREYYESAGNAVAVDSESNIIVVGNTEADDQGVPESNQIFVAKYSPKGNLLWQRSLGDTPGSERGYAVDVSSSNNIIVGGSTLPDGLTTVQMYAVSLDSDGELIWQHSLDTGALQGSIQGVVANEAGLHPGGATFVGTVGTGSSQRYMTYRYDPASTPKVRWQNAFEDDTPNGRTNFEAFDIASSPGWSPASNQLLVSVGSYTSTANGSDCFFNVQSGDSGVSGQSGSSGLSGSNTDKYLAVSQIGTAVPLSPLVSLRQYICTGFTDSPSSGSDEVILVGRYTGSFSGFSWFSTFGGNGGKTGRGLGATQDSQDRDTANIYIVGYTQPTTAANATEGYILKLGPSSGNTMGSVLWQRKITATGVDSNGGAVRLTGVKVDYNGDVVVSGITSNASTISTGESNVFVAKLPSDGSGTGTFGRFTYAAESLYVNTSPGLYYVYMGIYEPDNQTFPEGYVPTLSNDDTSQFTVVE